MQKIPGLPTLNLAVESSLNIQINLGEASNEKPSTTFNDFFLFVLWGK